MLLLILGSGANPAKGQPQAIGLWLEVSPHEGVFGLSVGRGLRVLA